MNKRRLPKARFPVSHKGHVDFVSTSKVLGVQQISVGAVVQVEADVSQARGLGQA